jgi:hypothetical protein
VRDTLPRVVQIKESDTFLVREVPGDLYELYASGHPGIIATPGRRIDDMIHGAEYVVRVLGCSVTGRQAAQCEAAGAFMQKYSIDIDERRTIIVFCYGMILPDFFEQG